MSPRLLLLLLIVALNTACLSVYRPDLQQGNAVTPEMVEKLKVGMTRNQVRFVLGTPLIADVFHPDRWDYYFFLKQSGDRTAEQRILTVYFENDVLVRFVGDVVPRAAQPAGAAIPQPPGSTTPSNP